MKDSPELRKFVIGISHLELEERQRRYKWMRRRVLAREILERVWAVIFTVLCGAVILVCIAILASAMIYLTGEFICLYPMQTACGP